MYRFLKPSWCAFRKPWTWWKPRVGSSQLSERPRQCLKRIQPQNGQKVTSVIAAELHLAWWLVSITAEPAARSFATNAVPRSAIFPSLASSAKSVCAILASINMDQRRTIQRPVPFSNCKRRGSHKRAMICRQNILHLHCLNRYLTFSSRLSMASNFPMTPLIMNSGR